MRTTLTLEPDVEQKVRRRMAETKQSLKQVVNEALREGLSKPRHPVPEFRVKPYPFRFKPGIDRDKLSQVLDQLDVEEFIRKRDRDEQQLIRRRK